MGIEEKVENGGNANVDLGSLGQIDIEFNRGIHERLREALGDDFGYDNWVVIPGVSFGQMAGPLGKPGGVIYVPNDFFLGWLNNPKKDYHASLGVAFREKGLETWKFVVDPDLCEKAKGIISPVRPNLEGVPNEAEEDSRELHLRKKRSRDDFNPGEPPAELPDFEDFVIGKSVVNLLASEGAREVAKPNQEKPELRCLLLCGPEGAGKKILLQASLQAMLKINPKLEVFYASGAAFQSLYASFFSTGESGATNVDRRRLGIFEKRLLSAKVLVIPDIDGTSRGAKGTRRRMAEAIRLTREMGKRGGRVLISSSREPNEEDLGTDLYRKLQSLQVFRVEKIDASLYREVAGKVLAKSPLRRVTARGNKGGEALDPKVIDWLVEKSKDGGLPLFLGRLRMASFFQGCGVNGHLVTLAEAQELFKLPASADDLVSLISEGDENFQKGAPSSEVLELACYLASLVLGLEQEVVANWFYPDSPWGQNMVAGGVIKIKEKLRESAEARLQLSGLVEELLRRFSVPEERRRFWARQLEEWNPPIKKSPRKRRCHR